MADTWMGIKGKVAKWAREFYKRLVTPYDFVIGQVDKENFNIVKLFNDTTDPSMINIKYEENFLFAYEINPDALNKASIPQLTEDELKDCEPDE